MKRQLVMFVKRMVSNNHLERLSHFTIIPKTINTLRTKSLVKTVPVILIKNNFLQRLSKVTM